MIFSLNTFKLKGSFVSSTPLFLINLISGPVIISILGLKVLEFGKCSVIIKYLYFIFDQMKKFFIKSLERCCKTCRIKHISLIGN